MGGDWRQATTIGQLREAVEGCLLCPLGKTRNNLVLGSGNEDAEVMFVGEAPGYHEDQQGMPFVGPAGQFLDQLLRSIGLERSQVYIANTLKCRPPDNRDPLPEELAACTPYLFKQIEIIKPRIICTLGNHATRTILGTSTGISQLHGKLLQRGGLVYVPLFHPAAALHKPPLKAVLIEDFQRLREHLEAERARRESEPGETAVTEEIVSEQPEQMGLF